MINDNFDIIALNGLTGECLTTDDLPELPDADDCTQRLKENPMELGLVSEEIESIRLGVLGSSLRPYQPSRTDIGGIMTVDPILILPCSTPEFERGLWAAVMEAPGCDWDETEKEYLRRNEGIRESLADWAEFMKFSHAWTKTNAEFIRLYATKTLTFGVKENDP